MVLQRLARDWRVGEFSHCEELSFPSIALGHWIFCLSRYYLECQHSLDGRTGTKSGSLLGHRVKNVIFLCLCVCARVSIAYVRMSLLESSLSSGLNVRLMPACQISPPFAKQRRSGRMMFCASVQVDDASSQAASRNEWEVALLPVRQE